MRRIIFFTLLLISFSTQAQTYTTAQLSTYLRSQWKTNDSLRKANAALVAKAEIKDIRDDERNVKIDSLFRENKRLTEKLDSAGFYYNPLDFDVDSDKQISIKPKRDTFIIIRSEKPAQQLVTAKKARKAITQNLTQAAPITLSGAYKFETDKPQPQQDIDDLKWQINYFEKLLDDDKKVIDKLQKVIDKQQEQIEKLTKQTEY